MHLIRPNFNFYTALLLLSFTVGCASTQNIAVTSENETSEDAVSALQAIAGSYSQEELSEEQMQEALKQIQNDEEAQSAIEAITGTYEGESSGIKYSPVTGKRYSGDIDIDPETGVKLIPLEP